MIYRRTKNLREVQLLLGHTKLESTVRYLGIEVDDALEMAEQTEVWSCIATVEVRLSLTDPNRPFADVTVAIQLTTRTRTRTI
jgi:hypothetical protein